MPKFNFSFFEEGSIKCDDDKYQVFDQEYRRFLDNIEKNKRK